MQKLLVCFLLISSMVGLSQNDSPVIFQVTPACETIPVESPDDTFIPKTHLLKQ